jgi:stearoyl-CoA desaturase (delta-9 desaturase)
MSTTLEPSRSVRKKHRRASQPVAVASSPSSPADAQQQIYDSFSPSRLKWNQLDTTVFVWMLAMHVGALAAPFFFTWQAFGVAMVMWWLTGSIGVCLGYHRYLSHKSLKLAWPAKFFTMLCGTLSGEGSPMFWAATHRLHHQRSDQPGDPHSPNDGELWSHLLWLFGWRSPVEKDALLARYAPDLARDPMMQFFEKTYGLWLIGTGVALYFIGGLPMLLWGLCVRMVWCYHATWFVNSATHIWGYRNYETRDRSRNLWWVAIIAWGEGWHNNHHAHPHTARAGHKWWEFDMTWWAICALRSVGLAYDVDDRIPTATSVVEG